MRRIGLCVVAAAVVVVGLYYGSVIYPQQRFRTALDQALGQLPPEYSVTYKAADYSWLSGRATLTAVTIHRESSQILDAAIDQIEVIKPSLDFMAAWSQAAANPAAIAPDTALPVSNVITLKGGTLRLEAGTYAIASLSIEGMRVYPWALLHPGVPSLAEAQAALTSRARPPQLANFLPLLRYEASVLLGVGYDRYTAENMQATIKVPAMTNIPAMDVSYAVREMSGSGFDRGAEGAGAAAGMTVQSSAMGTFTADRVVLANLDVRKPLSEVLARDELSAEMLEGLAIGRLEYSGMTIQLPTGAQIPLGTLSMSNIAFSHGQLVSEEVAYSGLRLSRSQISNPQALDAFSKLGVDAITLSFGATYHWDIDQKHITVRDAVLKVDELGALTLSVDVSDMAPGVDWQNQAHLAHLLLRYDDASLADRALRAGAAQKGADPAAFRQQLIALAQQQALALGNGPAIAAAVKAVIAFLDTPHSLTVELTPPAPLTLTVLQGMAEMPPADRMALLGLTMSANQ